MRLFLLLALVSLPLHGEPVSKRQPGRVISCKFGPKRSPGRWVCLKHASAAWVAETLRPSHPKVIFEIADWQPAGLFLKGRLRDIEAAHEAIKKLDKAR